VSRRGFVENPQSPKLAEILESGGSDIGKKLEPAAFFFSL
jgi:hypothetical protein